MTVTGAAMRANVLAEVKPSVMIVEEAAEILEGQLVAVIPPSVQHLIMIGDHKQLRPVVQSTRLRKENKLELSMFERLANCQVPLQQLESQGRMRDEIVELLRKLDIYKELKTNEKLVRENVLPDCVEKSMFFYHHTSSESASNDHSKRNSREAREITKVAETFCKDGRVNPSKITVLCAYRGQVTEMKENFKKSNVKELSDIKVTTIDSFQGQENDIILISLVRSNDEKKIGFLSQSNRLCVAISRARCGLYLFGNKEQLRTARVPHDHWKVIIDYMEENNCLGETFPFCSSVVTGEKSPSKDKTASVTNITLNFTNVQQANVAIGENANLKVIGSPEPSSPGTTQNIQISTPVSDKTPVQNPLTPPIPMSPGHMPVQSGGEINVSMTSNQSTNEETRKSIPETQNPKKSLDFRKDEEKESGQKPFQNQGFENTDKGKSVQETQGSVEARKTVLQENPVQESTRSTESWKEEALPTQETMPAGKGPFEETGDAPKTVTQETRQIKAKGVHEDCCVQSETESCMDETLPTQETMAAGKGPFEETGDAQEPEPEKTRKIHEEFTEGNSVEDSSSVEVETESCKEGLPTQETMASGKGPFEETGDANEALTQGTRQIKEKEVHEDFTGKPVVETQESTSVEENKEDLECASQDSKLLSSLLDDESHLQNICLCLDTPMGGLDYRPVAQHYGLDFYEIESLKRPNGEPTRALIVWLAATKPDLTVGEFVTVVKKKAKRNDAAKRLEAFDSESKEEPSL